MSNGFKALMIGLAGATCLASAANAGGFSRGNADTDILYEDGNFAMRAGVTYVAPQRGYTTINGVAATDPKFTQSYAVPSGAIKLNLTDYARCAGTYTQVYGANTRYGPQAQEADRIRIMGVQTSNATSAVDLGVDEFGLTCAVGFSAGSGKAWVLGGMFLEKFDYREATDFGTLTFDGDYTPGFRLGAAYEIPDIAFRAQLMYRSQVKHTPDGTYVGFVPNGMGGFILPPSTYSTVGEGTTPQSVELKLQSGVAAGTLVFGSIKWTDWSVIDTLDYTIGGVVPNRNEYFWKDGWTVNAGVGRQFNDWLSGSLSLTWDQGVSTTEEILTDTWTIGAGLEMSNEHASLQFGGALSYLTGGSQTADPNPFDLIPSGADFAATVDGDWSYALGARFKVNW